MAAWFRITKIENKKDNALHLFAFGSIRAESSQVIHTEHSSHVSVPAQGTMPAESSIIPRTVFHFTLRIDVEKWALFVVTGI
jgi:hypothetical protein